MDEPWWFGQIAAANALSDVYSMGGWPLVALNLVMFPEKKLVPTVLREILNGGADKVAEAGASIAGGHSVDDLEPKYGLSVTGMVDPDKVIRNSGARTGDALLLTKPIGSGVIFNAHRSGKLTFMDIAPMLKTVASLNGPAMSQALEHEVHACTDITGFGIIGHIYEMASASRVNVVIDYKSLPLYDYSLDMYRRGVTTLANLQNRLMTQDNLNIAATLDSAEEELLFDPQTSGGLLIAMPQSDAEATVYDIKVRGNEHAIIIGRVTGPGDGMIEVV